MEKECKVARHRVHMALSYKACIVYIGFMWL